MGSFADDVLGIDDNGGLMDPFGVGAIAEDVVKSVTGQSAADEARRAGNLQAEAGREAQAGIADAQIRLEEALAPFAQFSAELLPRGSELFGQNAAQAALNDPVLQAIQDDAQQRILASQAARGRTNAGDTPALLQENFLRNSQNFLNNERNSLLNALGIGQASAAQTGISGINTAGQVGDIGTQISNALGAAGIAGQQARGAGIGNAIGLLGSIFAGPLGGLGGAAAGGGLSGITGTSSGLLGNVSGIV